MTQCSQLRSLFKFHLCPVELSFFCGGGTFFRDDAIFQLVSILCFMASYDGDSWMPSRVGFLWDGAGSWKMSLPWSATTILAERGTLLRISQDDRSTSIRTQSACIPVWRLVLNVWLLT